MDVQSPASRSPIVYERPPQVLRHATVRTEPVFPEDVIDCVEITTTVEPPSQNSAGIRYAPSINLDNDKGTLIDLWI